MKLTSNLIIICVILFLGGSYLLNKLIEVNKDRIRLTENIETLNSEISYRKSKDSLTIAENNSLQYTVRELKLTNNHLVKEVESLNIKLKNVKSISDIKAKIKDSVLINWKDSIIYDTINVKTASYRDKWTVINIIENNLTYSTDIQFLQVIHDSRTLWRKLQFWKPITVRQSIKSYNPHCTITYMENIPVVK